MSGITGINQSTGLISAKSGQMTPATKTGRHDSDAAISKSFDKTEISAEARAFSKMAANAAKSTQNEQVMHLRPLLDQSVSTAQADQYRDLLAGD
jgi:hypothetical protein